MSRCGRPKCRARLRASVPLPEAAGPSMAMIIGNAPPAAPSELWNVGKLVAIMRESSIAIGRARGKAETKKAHRDAMVEMGLDQAAARDIAAAALDDEIVTVDLIVDPGRAQARPRSPPADRIP